MGVSHIAVAVKDIHETHRFYSEAMGFELVKTEVIPKEDGFARHVFYSTGSSSDQLMAFWDLADDPTAGDFSTDICRDLGLPPVTNHLAFTAADQEELETRKRRWLELGLDVLEIDHGWIVSIYTEDPDGITVEFAVVTEPFTPDEAVRALELLKDPSPPRGEAEPKITFHTAEKA